MSAGRASESWFDRLAAPQTRRQTLKAALAGVALTLPFARPGTGVAANPNGRRPDACKKGCFYTTYVRQYNALQQCSTGPNRQFANNVFLEAFFGLVGGTAIEAVNRASQRQCIDQTLLRGKAQQYDCFLPDCPGFDPEGPDGPCAPCKAVNGQCCPYQEGSLGYLCCSCCHESGNGCSSCS